MTTEDWMVVSVGLVIIAAFGSGFYIGWGWCRDRYRSTAAVMAGNMAMHPAADTRGTAVDSAWMDDPVPTPIHDPNKVIEFVDWCKRRGK